MEIKFENLPAAGNGTIYINDLTVIYGRNNTGKTRIAYTIFQILYNLLSYFDIGLSDSQIQKSINELKSSGNAEIDVNKQIENFHKCVAKIENKINSNLHNNFSINEKYFKNTKIFIKFNNLSLNKNEIISHQLTANLLADFQNHVGDRKIQLTFKNGSADSNLLEREYTVQEIRSLINLLIYTSFFGKLVPVPFPVSSERTGISLFHKVFDYTNSVIIKKLITSHEVKNQEKLRTIVPTYASSIEEDINRVRFYEEYSKNSSFITRDEKKYKILLTFLSELVEGTFSSNNGAVFFHPKQSKYVKVKKIPLHSASSSVKALFTLDIFVRHLANPDQILIIDEPELNLHPEKQVLMARLVAGLVNIGIKVLITTHSDFFIREINNLVILNSADKKLKTNVMQDHGVSECEILDHNRISAFCTSKNLCLESVEVDRLGLNTTMFDDVFQSENKKRYDIVSILEDEN